jgi:hypothetical protein
MNKIYQPNRYGHLPEVQEDGLEWLPDHCINNCARLALAKSQRPINNSWEIFKFYMV